jgi:hypothetical protein
MGLKQSKDNQKETIKKEIIIENTKEIFPILVGESKILKKEDIKFLCNDLPSEEFSKKWNLLYSSTKHGKSFNRFCFHIVNKGSTIILIRDEEGYIFGGFCEESWKPKYPKFYGSPRSFLFQLYPIKKIWKSTGINDHYQYLNHSTETLFNGVGQGGQINFFAWSIDNSFEKGKCCGSPSTTFGNFILSKNEEFFVDYVEVWQIKELEIEETEDLGGGKSVLNDEGNDAKFLVNLLGHEFSQHPPKEMVE